VIAPAKALASIAEWGCLDLPGIQLSARDRPLAAMLAKGRRLDIFELRDGLRIEAQGWIGVVHMECCTIRVNPVLISGHRSLIRLLQYVRRLDLLKQLATDATFEADGVDLFDLMALLLAQACERVLSMGPQADYVHQNDELPVLRGRLDVKVQGLRRWGRVDRLICDFDERVREIPENRWLVRALRFARRRVTDLAVGHRVKRASSAWEELCEDDGAEVLPRPEITRTNIHYRDALNLAYFVLDGVTALDVLKAGPIGGFSFMLNMPKLFEEFTSCLLESIAMKHAARVQRQASDGSVLWNVDLNKSFGQVRPDVLLTSIDGRVQVPVDAKYKDYGNAKLYPSDVYQGAIYALTLARQPSPRRVPICVVLHPCATGTISRQRVLVRVGEVGVAEVVAIGVPVDDLLERLPSVDGAWLPSEPWYATIAGMLAPAVCPAPV